MATILIGDVHGCAAELSELLERLGPRQGDQVVFVGDLVARGPDSPGVLRLIRELGGRAVRGNHEERLLAARAARRKG
ncbi:MAG: metallophosphoesterase, partial [Myxococcota bacterium]|nr:metallophosphoesterase [Myxococcota bacterium]